MYLLLLQQASKAENHFIYIFCVNLVGRFCVMPQNLLFVSYLRFDYFYFLQVFHGADMDIGWLQRDFGIYVVNMFDTGQAARVLNYGKYSLAFLLKKFCDVTANKQYQLADWRIRLLVVLLCNLCFLQLKIQTSTRQMKSEKKS